MAKWTPFPHAGDYSFDATSVKKHWARLHTGDAEPCPKDAAVLQAWALFHSGDFEKATAAGLAAGGPGITVANKATAIYANYLEQKEKTRLDLFTQVAERAEAQAGEDPNNANAWYWHAYALGRYSQGISVAKALTQGLGVRVKHALETAIARCPHHADAHLALAAFHAEVIDKVGSMVGGMTYGANKATGLALYQKAMALNPDSVVTLTEYANGLVMLEGTDALPEANRLLDRAASIEPQDAMEHLYVATARVALDS